MTIDRYFDETFNTALTRDVLRNDLREIARRGGAMETGTALQLAAGFVEFAAYEMARRETSEKVAQLILLSAELDRVATRFREAA